MKKSKSLLIAMAVILTSSLFITCQKESNEPNANESEVAFTVNISHPKSASLMNRAMVYDLVDADRIILTIQNSDGSPTKYTSSEVKIEQMNGHFYTQKIVLKTGNYKLSEFLILNANDSTIFAAPLVGSQEAQNVSSPLPIAFTVTKDITTPVNVEVLSTESKKPEDFGLNSFPILEVKTFGFMIGITDKENSNLLSAKLTVSNGAYSYVQNLDSILNNIVTIKDSLSSYTLTVEKDGYKTYTHTYSLDSLKMFKNEVGNLPLVIELEKELTVTDIDGNVYHTVKIGTQIWMKENLKVTHYRNGDPITDGTGIGYYSGLAEPKYYFNNNDDTSSVAIYGRTYTWFAITDSRNVCPAGWRIPSNAELITIETYLGGSSAAGGKMKETGTIYWNSPNTDATNESGFSGLPTSVRGNGGGFSILGVSGCFWSLTGTDAQYAWYYGFSYNNADLFRYPGGTKKDGLSVRCIKD